MVDLNNCSFTGRLTADAIQKTLPTGTELVTFDIANTTGFGQYAKTTYVKCSLWGKLGTAIKQYLIKGKPVAVCGAITVDQWTGTDGVERSKLALNCVQVILLADGKGKTIHEESDGSW